LALLVTTDFNIPLFHAVYPGNRADSTEFQSLTEDLVARYRALRDTCDRVTLVYDKGNNSAANQAAVDASPFSFVGALKANQVPDLLAVPLTAYTPLPDVGVQAYRTMRTVFGVERTVVVTYNEALFLGQWQGEFVRLRKLHDRLRAIQQGVTRAARTPSAATVRQRVARALAAAGPPARSWVTTTVTEGPDGPTLTWTIDHAACLAWGQTHWGKTILFTDHADWSTAQIITAYRDAWHVAQTFRDLKQAPWLRWQPPFHWTDDTMRVHGFLCILAVTLAHLLRRHYAQAGLPLSLPELLQDLTAMQQVLLVYPSGSGIPDRLTLTDRTPRQQQLLDLLDIPVPDVTAR
jgi:transposase